MKITSKAKVSFVVVSVLMLAGAVLLLRHTFGKPSDKEKQLNQESAETTNNTSSINKHEPKSSSVNSSEKIIADEGNSDAAIESTTGVALHSTEDVLDNLPLPVPPESDFSGPEPFQDLKISRFLMFSRQDGYYAARLPYDQVASKTRELIKSHFSDSSECTVPWLLEFARKKQREYWTAGGLDNANAYKLCYTAQAAVELAILIDPNNPKLYEESAEIIGAAHPLVNIRLEGSVSPETNHNIIRQLITIREKQLDIYETSDQHWRQPINYTNPVFKVLMELTELYCMLRDADGAAMTLKKADKWAYRGGGSNMKNILQRYATGVQSNNFQWPVELYHVSPRGWAFKSFERRGGEEFETMKKSGANGLTLGSPWFRRTLFHEGPLYVKRVTDPSVKAE